MPLGTHWSGRRLLWRTRRCLGRPWSLGLLLISLVFGWSTSARGQRVNLANTNQVYNTLARGNGGTGVSVSGDDIILVGNGTLWQPKTIPNCLDTLGQHLNYDQSTNTFSCGTSGAATPSLPPNNTFSTSATSVVVTHNLGFTISGFCIIGTFASHVPWLINSITSTTTTATFNFSAASGNGLCYVVAGGSGGGGGGTGTVTSVGLSGISGIITVSGSPVTTSDTLALALSTQSANLVFAGPGSGSAAAPTFRSLVALDIPSLDAAKITSGTLATARVVSGSITNSRCLHVDSSGNVTVAGADCNAGGGGGGNIGSINSEVGPAISLGSDTAGSDFSISTTATNTITWHFPSAGPAERGLVTTGNQSFSGTKTFLNKVAFNNPADPGCPGSEYSIYAASGTTDRFKACLGGVASQLGNVYSTTGGISGNLARYLGTGTSRLDDGLAYSQSATANSILQRDSTGGLAASTGSFSSNIYVSPSTSTIAGVFQRGSAGQTIDILQVNNEIGSRLAYFDYGGRLVGPVWDKAGAVWNVMAYAAGATINDGTTAARAAIQAAIDACEATTNGGVVLVPYGRYAITDGVPLALGNGNGNTPSTKPPCSLEGSGSGFYSTYSPTFLGGTELVWTGSAPGAATAIVKMNGPSKGGGVSKMVLNANGKANLSGLLIENVADSSSYDLYIANSPTMGATITSRSQGSPSGTITHGACGNKFYNFKIVYHPLGAGGGGLLLDGFDTTDGADSCSNGFFGYEFWHDSSTAGTYGVKLAYTDNNRFHDGNLFSFGGYAVGSISTSGSCPCTSVTNGTGTVPVWTAAMTGARFNIGGVDYTFTRVSATTGTISPAAASTFSNQPYTFRHGYGVQFAKSTNFPGFPQENHFHNTSSHNGVGGTTGAASPNIFTNWNIGDCYVNCDPYRMLGSAPTVNTAPVSSGTSRDLTGIGAIRHINPTDPNSPYLNYWMWGDDVNGTQLYRLKRGAPSGNGLDLWSFNEVQFSGDGDLIQIGDGARAYYGKVYSNTTTVNYSIIGEKHRGTQASPAAITNGEELLAIAASGRNAAGTQSFAHRINMVVDTVDGSNIPVESSMIFGTSSLGVFGNQWGVVGSAMKAQHNLAGVQLLPLGIGALPTCNSVNDGKILYVNDALSPTYNATISAGGAVKTLVLCNATNWVAH